MVATKKRGRPPGSRTSCETPAMKRARRYFELLGDGMKSAAAARAVAAEPAFWPVAEGTVFSDARRHVDRITEQIRKETRAVRIELGRMIEQAYPDTAVALALEFRSQPQGSDQSGDEWLAFLGEQYFTFPASTRRDGLAKPDILSAAFAAAIRPRKRRTV